MIITTPLWSFDVKLVTATYQNGTMAIEGVSNDSLREPCFTATVAIPMARPAEGCVFLKGWSENEGLPEALEKAGVVRLTGRKVPTGYVEAVEAEVLSLKGNQ